MRDFEAFLEAFAAGIVEWMAERVTSADVQAVLDAQAGYWGEQPSNDDGRSRDAA